MNLTIVIDANIVWSTAYRASSQVGQLVMASDQEEVSFYAPSYLKSELDRHLPKIVELSGQTQLEVTTVLQAAYRKLKFISDAQIPFAYFQAALPLVRDIDIDDIVFVALNDYLSGYLWTGDRQLYNGLKAKGYQKVVNLDELKVLLGTTK